MTRLAYRPQVAGADGGSSTDAGTVLAWIFGVVTVLYLAAVLPVASLVAIGVFAAIVYLLVRWRRGIGLILFSAYRTFVSSVVQSVLLGIAIGVAGYVALLAVFAWSDLVAAISQGSIGGLSKHARFAPLAVAVGAVWVAAWGLSDYIFAGRDVIAATLRKLVPNASVLKHQSHDELRSHYRLLKLSSAMAFIFEFCLQVAAFGIAMWGLAAAFPELDMLRNPAALTISNAVFFWVQVALSAYDGPTFIGTTLTPLQANDGALGLAAAIVFFKVVVAGLLVRLIRESIMLGAGDISTDLAAAIEAREREELIERHRSGR